MKYKFVFILFLLSFLINCSDYFTKDDIIFHDDTLYFKDSTLFNGELRTYYQVTGELLMVEEYKDGLRDGKLIQYYKNGYKKEQIEYKNGKKFGYHISYFSNGNKGRIKGFKNDTAHGIEDHFFRNGQVWRRMDFENGKLVGQKIYELPEFQSGPEVK